MTQIERTVVASGIIGLFNQEWIVVRLYDRKYNEECYNLYINKEYFGHYHSIVEALDMLVNQFKE